MSPTLDTICAMSMIVAFIFMVIYMDYRNKRKKK
jgi:hypothetical protein